MNQATNVNIVPSYGQRGDLHFSQYDVGRTATINLYAVNEAYTIPVGATVKIQATKPSGLGFDVACTFSGSVVTVVSTETMTAEAGRFPCELRITKDSDVIGTANFMFVVEASPHPDGVIDGDAEEVVNEIKALVLQSEGYALGTQDGVPVGNTSPYYHNNAKYYSENVRLSDEFRQALLNCFSHVAWIDENGQDYYDALDDAMTPDVVLESITAVYTQSGEVDAVDSLDSLKNDLVVTAYYDDSSTATITGYTLSGTLVLGTTSTITVSYGGKTDTFDVNVSSKYYLFKEGNECTTNSGGWQTKGFNTGISSYVAENDGTYLKLAFTSGSSTASARSLSTTNAIDFTDYTKLTVICSGSGSSGTCVLWAYYPTTLNESTTQSGAYGNDYSSRRNTMVSTSSAAYPADGTEYTREIDVTSYTGNAYISFNWNCYNGFAANSWAKVKAVYFE